MWGAVSGAALAVGPLAGGALVDGLGWRSIFLVNLPAGIALVVVARRRLQESRDLAAGHVDVAGMALWTGALFLATFALIRGNAEGWGSAPIAGALGAAALLLAAFALRELRTPQPMLDLRLFRIPAFAGTAAVAFAQSAAIYPMFLFLALYFQDVLGHGPFATGLRLLPVTLTLFAVAPVAGRLTARVPLRALLAAGLALIAASLALMRGLQPDSEWTALLPGLLVGGAGIGVISPALAAAMVGVLPAERSGIASGVNNTFRQVGIAAGIAGLGAVFQHRIASGVEHAVAGEGGERLGRMVAEGRLDDALAAAGVGAPTLEAAARAGFVDGLNAIFAVAALVAVAGLAACALVRPRDLAGAGAREPG